MSDMKAGGAEAAASFSSVQHMTRDNVAFSLGLRSSPPMSNALAEAFLPHGAEFQKPQGTADEGIVEGGERRQRRSKISSDSPEALALLRAYEGCPEDYDPCNMREAKSKKNNQTTQPSKLYDTTLASLAQQCPTSKKRCAKPPMKEMRCSTPWLL